MTLICKTNSNGEFLNLIEDGTPGGVFQMRVTHHHYYRANIKSKPQIKVWQVSFFSYVRVK